MTTDERTVLSALELLDAGKAEPYRVNAFKRIRARIAALEDALARSRVLVAMDTLPENVPDPGQRQAASEVLDLIDSLIP